MTQTQWWHTSARWSAQNNHFMKVNPNPVSTSWSPFPFLLPESHLPGRGHIPSSWHLWAGPTVCPWAVPGVSSTWAFHPGTSGSLWGGGGGLWSQGSLQPSAVPQTQLHPQRTALWASSPVPQLPHRPPTHTHTSSNLMDPEIQGREGDGPGTQDKWKLVLLILFFRTRMDMITNSSLSQALILLLHVTDPHFISEEIAHAGPICPLDRWRNWGRCSDLPKVRSNLGSKIRWNSCHLTL